MDVSTDGRFLFAANNAEDPPFWTLFRANGDAHTSAVVKLTKVLIDNSIVPKDFGLSIEQRAWEPVTKRFYTSIPTIANTPRGLAISANCPATLPAAEGYW